LGFAPRTPYDARRTPAPASQLAAGTAPCGGAAALDLAELGRRLTAQAAQLALRLAAAGPPANRVADRLAHGDNPADGGVGHSLSLEAERLESALLSLGAR